MESSLADDLGPGHLRRHRPERPPPGSAGAPPDGADASFRRQGAHELDRAVDPPRQLASAAHNPLADQDPAPARAAGHDHRTRARLRDVAAELRLGDADQQVLAHNPAEQVAAQREADAADDRLLDDLVDLAEPRAHLLS